MSHLQRGERSGARPRGTKRQARLTMRRRLRSRIAALRPRLVAAPERNARAVGLVVLAACIALLYAFAMADMFYAGAVVVEGNSLLTAEELSQAARARNFNIFYLQFGDIERRVSAVPGVRAATASYEFPNVVRLTVIERTPILVWENGRRTSWVDESGTLFPVGKAPADLPVVRDADGKPPERVDPGTVAGIRALFAAQSYLRRVEYADLRGLTFTDGHGWKVIFGAPEQINAKLAMLESLGAYLVAQKVEPEYVDVRQPERAFYKPK